MVLRFGGFELDRTSGELRKQGRLVALTGQPLRVLELLALNAGQIVTRQELQRQIWGTPGHETHVDFDASLSTCINHVRTALGDRAVAPRFVETLPRRGYRFVAPVESIDQAIVPNPTDFPRAPKRRGWRGPLAAGAIAAVVATVVVINQSASTSPSSPPTARALPVVVLPVWLDSSLSGLEPLASSLTDSIIGALATEGGEQLWVASPVYVRHLREGVTGLNNIRDLGAEYFVTTKLFPIGNRINVHAKVTRISGWMLWSTDRSFRLEELPSAQLSLASDLSKLFLREIQADLKKTLASR